MAGSPRQGGGNRFRLSLPKLHALDAQQAVPILAALVEVLWAYAWFAWIGSWDWLGWPRPPLSLIAAVVLVVGAEALSRWTLARDWPLARTRLVVLLSVALLLALAVRLGLNGGHALWDTRWVDYAAEHRSMLAGSLAFGAYLLWRGISLGREAPTFDGLYRRFVVGLAGMAVLLVMSGVYTGGSRFGRSMAAAGPYVVAYFCTGLLALALVNSQSIRAKMAQQAEASELFSRRWLSLVAGAVLAIALLAVGISSVFSFELLTGLLHALGVLGDWLLTALIYLIAYPLGVLASVLIYLWQALRGLLGPQRDISPERFSPPSLQDLRQTAEGQTPQGIPDWLVPTLKWGLVALVVLLIALVLARALARYAKARPDDETAEVHESLWSWAVFKQDLWSYLAGLLHRLRRRRVATAVRARAPEATSEYQEGVRLFDVREIYRALLWEGRQVGLPRSPWETPHEYGDRLRSRLTAGNHELRAITDAYAAERYGNLALGGEQLQQINHGWRTLRSALRGLLPTPR